MPLWRRNLNAKQRRNSRRPKRQPQPEQVAGYNPHAEKPKTEPETK